MQADGRVDTFTKDSSGNWNTDPMLDMHRYEAERPAESVACHVGDERMVFAPNVKIIPPSSVEGAIPIEVDFRGKYNETSAS